MSDAPLPLDRTGLSDEDYALWGDRSDDPPERRERLFHRYAAFARLVGRRAYRSRNMGDIDLADVDQLAYVCLIEALERFDPDRKVSFEGFASVRIAGGVIDGISKMSEMREQISWRHRMRRDRIQSMDLGDCDKLSTEDALAALTELAVGLAVGFMLEGTQLYQDETASAQSNAYETANWKNMNASLQAGLRALPERERSIITFHYLDGVAFEALATLFGISKGRVAQLHRAALGRLRKAVKNQGHFRLEQ